LGWVGEPAVARLLEPALAVLGPAARPAAHGVSLVIAYVVVSAMHIVVGEQAPKFVALGHPEGVALAAARPMRLFYRVFYPFVEGLNRATRALLAPLGFAGDPDCERHPEADARMIHRDSPVAGRDSDSPPAPVRPALR